MSPDAPLEPLAHFEWELLRSERLRAGLVGALMVVGSLVIGATLAITSATTGPRLPDGAVLTAFTGPVLLGAFELCLWWLLGRAVESGRMPFAGWGVVTIVLEITGCTGIMLLLAETFDPLLALHGPPSLLYVGFILVAILRLSQWLPIVAGGLAGLQYAALSIYLWPTVSTFPAPTQLVLPFPHGTKAAIYALVGVAAGWVAREVRRRVTRTLNEMSERQRVLDLFGLQVSPQVVDKLLSMESAFESELRSVCVMFLDIRNFTRFSEHRSPAEVVDYLNTLFDSHIGLIHQHNGVVNKFLGDGFMAIFGAPISDGRDGRNGVAAALAILEETERMVAAGAIPETGLGIGLHLGEVIVGNVGSKQRQEYTVIGDTVNTAARIEGLNKALGSTLLVSGAVRAVAMDLVGDAAAEKPLAVKGRVEPVQVYRVR